MKFPSFAMSVFVSAVLAGSVCIFVSCSPSSTRNEVTTLTIKGTEKGGRGISVESVNVEVMMVGDLAETTLDLVIRNSTSRELEASLDLPLPEGATISRYALDVEGAMREGVIVDKEQGRKAFENTIRQNIDPGLLEKTRNGGNNFRTRIYPVPANGTKRVLLSYTEPMQLDELGNYQYSLPLALKEKVKQFNLRMIANEGKSEIRSVRNLVGVSYTEAGELIMSARHYRSSKQTFSISANTSPQVMVQRGSDGGRYFYVSQSHASKVQYSRPAVNKLKLVWDTSHSSNQRNRDSELQLLDAYFSQNRNVTVDLTFIGMNASKVMQYRVVDGEWASLRQALGNVLFDGATSMSKLSLAGLSYGAIFYFGDGISTFDQGNKFMLSAGNVPVYLVNSSPRGNHALLSQLAMQSGGAYVNLYGSNHQSALDQLLVDSYKIVKVTGDGVSQMKFSSKNDVSSVSGILSNSSATLHIHYGAGGKIIDVVKVKVSANEHTVGGTMAAKIWAQRQVDSYAANPKLNRVKIVGLAKTHRLVTDFTSLIVLDRVSDYVQYRIIPPTEELRKQYYAELKYTPENEQGKPSDLDEVYEEWQVMVRWHKVGFPLAKNISSFDFKKINPNSLEAADAAYSAPSGPDFSAPIADSPAPLQSVRNIVTAGNRSGDLAITRDNIDSFLNNPNARSQPKSASIEIKGWEAQSSYAKALSAAAKSGNGELMSEYAQWKKDYQNSPSFYLDAAEVFLRNNQRAMAIQVLSNLAEIDAESAEMLRILAFRFSQMGEYALAEMLLREVVELRGEEPQSYRDLALVLAKRKQYSEASALLWKVVNTEWDWRFDGIKMIVLNEWNQIQRMSNRKLTSAQQRFRYDIDADLRVVIVWDTDNSDMDLWVTTPEGEKCYYGNELTKYGGKISQDLTDGRGPEEFMIRKSSDGKYIIQADYYGTREQTLAGPTTLTATIFTNWNRPDQKEEVMTFELGKEKQVIDVGDAGFR